MNYYKKIIKNEDVRFKILQTLRFVPDTLMVRIQYYIKTGRILNLKNPQRFTEKIQHYKIFYRNPLMTKCADKLLVRDYIKSKGFENILVPLIGVYKSADQIDFESLPDRFVLKTTDGSHTNIICTDKNMLNYDESRKKINYWMKRTKMTRAGREWAYYDIESKVICEKFLENKDHKNKEINDYKFICMHGVVKYVYVDTERSKLHKRNFYDTNWNLLQVESDRPNTKELIRKPEKLDLMINIATKLSEDFPHVRVDLYYVNNRIYFGELTFYTFSGYTSFKPDNFDLVLGNSFNITKY